MKCLVVDDDELSSSMLKEMLPSTFECDIASNGEEAVNLFARALVDMNPYHLIFMDVSMPICNGHYALAEIRSIEKEHDISSQDQVKIFMITAANDAKTIMESYYKGRTLFLFRTLQ